jgi:hypothetical protein
MLPAPPRPRLRAPSVVNTGSRDADAALGRGLEHTLPQPPRPKSDYAIETFRKTPTGINSSDYTYLAGVELLADSGYQGLVISVRPAALRSQEWRPNISGPATTGRNNLSKFLSVQTFGPGGESGKRDLRTYGESHVTGSSSPNVARAVSGVHRLAGCGCGARARARTHVTAAATAQVGLRDRNVQKNTHRHQQQ